MKSKCEKCGKGFEYEPRSAKARRKLCDGCREEGRKRVREFIKDRQRVLGTEESARDLDADGITQMRRKDVARIERTTTVNVHQIERRALAKIRQHPEAKKLFDQWCDEGCPTPARTGQNLLEQDDPGKKLLDWNLHLAEWWSSHLQLQESNCKREAGQLEREIRPFFKKLKRAIKETIGYGKHSSNG